MNKLSTCFIVVFISFFIIDSTKLAVSAASKVMEQKTAFKLLREFQEFLQWKVGKEATPNSIRVLHLLSNRLNKVTFQACQQCFKKDIAQFLFCADKKIWTKRFQFLEINNCF